MTKFETIILGAGVTGTALLHTLSHYTNVHSIALIEKYQNPAKVNSNSEANSQTLHFGDIETNYSVEKATKVSHAAQMIVNYLKRYNHRKIHDQFSKMVLGVGEQETEELKKRHEDFKKVFPHLELIDRYEIASHEPLVLFGRNKNESINALYTTNGYAVDFGKLSDSFISTKNIATDVHMKFGTTAHKIRKTESGFIVETDKGDLESKTLVAATGGHSLIFAKSLGYGAEYSILPVAGDFYKTKKRVLNGKVYTVQNPKLPFAAVHGDPDTNNATITRFGPTAKILPMLERGSYETVMHFFQSLGSIPDYGFTMLNLLKEKEVREFAIRNIAYTIPGVGRNMFIEQCKKIIPTLQEEDFVPGKLYGGVRPQLVKNRKLYMGEARIIGDNAIFDITPSPGASVCIKNAQEDAQTLCGFLGKKFDLQRFNKDYT